MLAVTKDAATEAALIALFRDDMHIVVPSPDTDLIEEGLLNSLVFVDLIVLLEERFGLTMPLESLEIDQLRTVGGIAALLHGLKQPAV
ncbi:acyl carrier protein [Azospirillum sp.]|uniref:acyl carrier protein n=1 Tax=Azospirillum sp. TaxID=34012 RepID=UPI002D65B5E1|nr:acyl carrier protein [Azospirillum sp.]HYD68790.1 acyl carrier protein [Azospirillum sp.]